jgi:hypothetical protein
VSYDKAEDYSERDDNDREGCSVESCPACGTVTDIEYVDSGHVFQEGNFPDSGNMPVNIPLHIQESLLYGGYPEAVGRLLDELDNADLLDLCAKRLREGYMEYGSTMFEWDADFRRRNIHEELADAIVYSISGEW